ncbi:hypothetical protein SCACP_19810 [Sporomusa carbonis]|uniref:LapA family protein n=1 Tax=Sporomusa carbonis TaxID=3076075 RepID=UPI003A6EF6B0
MVNLLFAFVFALLVAVLAVQNSLPVTVTFFVWSFQISLVVIILGAATFGAMTILSLAMLVQFKLRRSLYKTKQIQQQLEDENRELKAKYENKLQSQ